MVKNYSFFVLVSYCIYLFLRIAFLAQVFFFLLRFYFIKIARSLVQKCFGFRPTFTIPLLKVIKIFFIREKKYSLLCSYPCYYLRGDGGKKLFYFTYKNLAITRVKLTIVRAKLQMHAFFLLFSFCRTENGTLRWHIFFFFKANGVFKIYFFNFKTNICEEAR